MSEPVKSVVFAGRGVLQWPAGKQDVDYQVTVALDSVISHIRIAEPLPGILRRPIRHGDIYLYMQDGRRLALNVAPNGYLSADSPMERGSKEWGWWTDTTPWAPMESDHFMLAMKIGPVQVFQWHKTPEEAKAAYQTWQNSEMAEIRPPFGRPIQLK